MEVNRENFFWMLPQMLHEAQKARFVAVDVEMSGISSTQGRTNPIISVQDSYTRIKEAAEEFQVLQIGLTLFHYDENTSIYATRTFNCHVSPQFPRSPFYDSLTGYLDRKFSISTKSYSFLRQHQFELNKALDDGVFYLNHPEQRLAERFCIPRGAGDEHIDPSTLNDLSREFYETTKGQIEAFVTAHFLPNMEITIKNPHGDKLNGLQLRLIHQIVNEEYPMCRVKRITGGLLAGRVSVAPINQTEVKYRQQLNLEDVKKLSGLQILFEALSGGSFADRINQEWVYHRDSIPEKDQPLNEFNKTFNFQQCEANLKKARPILVGHNLFQDLAFIYNTFFEPLPPKVDDFLIGINQLFPRIVDTKFMHTRGRHMMEPDRTLQELYSTYSKLQFPTVELSPESVEAGARPHDAGFDSAMTTILFVKQTHALFNAKKHLTATAVSCYATKRQDNQSEKKSAALLDVASAPSKSEIRSDNLLDQEEIETLGALQKWSVLSADESASRRVIVSTTDASGTPSRQHEEQKVGDRMDIVSMPAETHSKKEVHMIPLWTDDFWRTYGNKTYMQGAGYVSFDAAPKTMGADEEAKK